jgi:hypothetical protein
MPVQFWEIGLPETQQTLYSPACAAGSGAEDGQTGDRPGRGHRSVRCWTMSGFATAPLVVEGCIMMRKRH